MKKNKTKNKTKNKILHNIDVKKKHSIYILYTGGTIGMSYDKVKGLIPIKDSFSKLIDALNLPQYVNIRYKVENLKNVIDSSNIKPDDWLEILQKLKDNYSKYDSFIIIHGTDTLAYTASLLSYYCKNWKKSITVTGSQIPMFEFRNDAIRNVRDSIIVSIYNIPQVFIVFGGECLRGNCTTKYSSTSFIAYKSPNIKPAGSFGVKLNLNYDVIDEGIVKSSEVVKKNLPNNIKLTKWTNNIYIHTITLVPGFNWDNKIHAVFHSNNNMPEAIILRSFGIGNAPVASEKFIQFLQLANKHKIIVVNTTQCFSGGVDMHIYKTGRVLENNNVLSGKKMTYEAIYTKLFYLFQNIGKNKKELIKKLFKINIAGELPSAKYYKSLRKTVKNKNKHAFIQYQEI